MGIESVNSSVKVLGLHWHPKKDTLSYNVNLAKNPSCTKRQVLSDVSRIFDPLGLLAPTVVQFKILFQKLWLLNLNWDDELPKKLTDKWLKWRADLENLPQLQIPRLVESDTDKIELHGFSDASTKAYSAVVYSRMVKDDGTISVAILAAKTRVAPLKQQSLPRLELCGSFLLSQLLQSIKAGLKHKDLTIYAWSDCTIVLSWLAYSPAQLKMFVGNRTAEILETIPKHAWRHVDSKSNPADCASRGLGVSELIDFQLWWKGPSWLRDQDQFLVKLNNSHNCSSLSDKRIQSEIKANCLAAQVIVTTDNPLDKLLNRNSSWLKLIHTLGYVLRFIHRMKHPSSKRTSTALTFDEIKSARIRWLQHAQAGFQQDFQLLLANKPLGNQSKLVNFSPFIDKDNLLRNMRTESTCILESHLSSSLSGNDIGFSAHGT
ncbi:uncharacterized protein [Drosophila bipectinata]|uniref:uncharacterized protein n=1 Tax=Drosophila bipectinata TaxID=42026 RepID=UPI001C8AFFFD|nr:uncharacterized protein LOC122321976 [Drosophila bipectinata]